MVLVPKDEEAPAGAAFSQKSSMPTESANFPRNPEAELRPRHLITNLEWQPGENAVQEGIELAHLYDITPSTDCSTCHR